MEKSKSDKEGWKVTGKEFVIGWKRSYWPETSLRPKASVNPYYKRENEIREKRVYVHHGKPSKAKRMLMED